MTEINRHDPLVTLAQAAVRLGVKEKRAKGILIKNGIQPVRTAQGIVYRLADVDAAAGMPR